MNSSFSVDDDDSSHFGDGDDADAYSCASSVVLVLPDEDQSLDEGEDDGSGGSGPFMVGNVPLYLAQGDDGKPVYIRQLTPHEKLPDAKTSRGGEGDGFGGFSNANGRTFEGFGSLAFEGFGEYNCDGDEKVQFDGFSEEDSAESVGGREKIVRLQKLQKLCKLTSDHLKDELLDDSDDSDGESEVDVEKIGKKIACAAKRRTKKREIKKQSNDVRPDKTFRLKPTTRRRSKDAAQGKDVGKVKNSPLSKRQKEKMGAKASPNNGDKSVPSHSDCVQVKTEDIEIKEEIQDNYDYIGIYCHQVGCTISWLESMTSKVVTVNNGIVFELSDFAKKINWEREHVAKWIMRLRGILDIEPSQEDLDKIHITLKRRKALTVTMSCSKKGQLKLCEFDSTEFTLPSCIRRNVEKESNYNLPQCNSQEKQNLQDSGGRKHTDNQHRRVSKIKQSSGSETKNPHEQYLMKDPSAIEDPKVSYHYHGSILVPYFKENCPIGPRCQAAGLTLDDLNSMNRKDILISLGMIVELCKFFHERNCPYTSLAFMLLKLKSLPRKSLRPLLCKLSSWKDFATEDEDHLNAEFKFPADRRKIWQRHPIQGRATINGKDEDTHSDRRVSFSVHNGIKYPYFNESSFYLGKYCSAMGLTVDHLNSREIMDFPITQGVAVELFTFYRDRSCSLRSIAETVARLGKGHPAKVNSMISTVWTVMKKAKNANEGFFKAKFPFPTARLDSSRKGRHFVVKKGQLKSFNILKDENEGEGKESMRKEGRPARKRTKNVRYQDDENDLKKTEGKRKTRNIKKIEELRKSEIGENAQQYEGIEQDFLGAELNEKAGNKRLCLKTDIDKSDFQYEICRKDVLVLKSHMKGSQNPENGHQEMESDVESGWDYSHDLGSGEDESTSKVSDAKVLKSRRERKPSEKMKASQESLLYKEALKEEPYNNNQSFRMSRVGQNSSMHRRTPAAFPKRTRPLSKDDDRVSFRCVDDHVIPYFKEKNFYLGDHCSVAGLTVQDLNSESSKAVHLTNGVVLELYKFYRERGCTNVALADRLLRMKNLQRVNLAYISARFPQLLQMENDEKKLRSEFKFRAAKVVPHDDDMLKAIENEDSTGGSLCEDNMFVDKKIEKARGNDGSITRADIVLLYGEWLRKKRDTGNDVFVTDLLSDVMKLMEERKIPKIRIPAGTLMSSSVKLYEEYKQMWQSNKKDAMMYLEEDWLEDIQYLVSITQTSRRSTVDGETSGLEAEGGVLQLMGSSSSSLDIFVGNVEAKLPTAKVAIASNDKDSLCNGRTSVNVMQADTGTLKDGSITSLPEYGSREEKGFGSSGKIVENSNTSRGKPYSCRRKPGPKCKQKNIDDSYDDEEILDCNGDSKEDVQDQESNEEVLPAVADRDDKKIFNMEGCEISQIIDYRCEVDKDLGIKQTSYLVRWKGFGPECDSWVKEKDLQCPELYTSLWGETSDYGKLPLDRLNLQKSNHYKTINFSRRLDMLETFRDLPDDINEPITIDSDSEDTPNDKENSPGVGLGNCVGISKLKERRGFVTNGEILGLYDDWRKSNHNSGKLEKNSVLDIQPLIAKVGKLLSSRGVDIKFSESLLQSCFVLTLTKRMLTSEEAVKKFLDTNCIPFLEKNRAQQTGQEVKSWKMKGSKVIGNLSNVIENLEHKFSEGRLTRSQNRLQLGVVEDETECLERSWKCSQGDPQFFSDALRNQVRKLNMTFARIGKPVCGDTPDVQASKGTDAEVPVKHKRACDELKNFGVEEKQVEAIVESVLEYVDNPDSYRDHSE